MVRLTENMVRKQREDDGPDLAGFDPLHPRLLEIAELLRKHPCAPARKTASFLICSVSPLLMLNSYKKKR